MKMKFHPVWLVTLFVLLISCFDASSAPTLTVEDYSSTAPVSKATLNARIEEAKAASELEDTERSRRVELYQMSIRYLEEIRSYNTEADKFIQARKAAPKLAKSIRDKLEKKKKVTSEVLLKVTLKTPFTEVQQHLFTEKANLAAVEAKLADLNLELAFIENRNNSILLQLNESKQEQERIFASLEAQATEVQSPALIEAQQWALQTQALALRSKIRMLDQELLSQPMRKDLLDAERDRQEFSVEYLSIKVRKLNEIVNSLRKKEAEKTLLDAEKAKREVANKHPVIRHLATENAKLSEEIRGMTTELDKVTARGEKLKKQGKRIAKDNVNTRKKLEIAGLSHALGQMLLEQRMILPDIRVLKKEADQREEIVSETALSSIRHKEELRHVQSGKTYTNELEARFQKEEIQLDQKDLKYQINARRKLLEKIISLDDAYFRALGELGFIQQKQIETVVDYHDFLAGKLLWVRSKSYPDWTMFLSVPGQLQELFSPEPWLKTGQLLVSQLLKSPILLALILIPLLLLGQAKQLRRRLQETCAISTHFSEIQIVDTLRAITLTILLAAPEPLLLGILGWAIQQSLDATDFSRAVAAGLFWVAPNYFYLRVIYVLCKPSGVAEAHFAWPKTFLQPFRFELKRLMILFLPIAFTTSFVINTDMKTMGDELGRLFAVFAQLILAYFFYRLFNKKTGALHVFFVYHPKRAISRFCWLWFTLTVISMLILAVFTFAGYVYTGAVLTNLILDSLMLVLALIIVQQLGERWLYITQHRLIRQAAIENNKVAHVKQAEKAGAENQEIDHLLDIEEPEIDLYTLTKDSRKLLDTTLVVVGFIGLGWLWFEVLPAFKFLEDITLWYHASTKAGQVETLPVTLADASFAIVIAIATYIAAKRLPALLEIILLQVSTPAGSRYTITTLTNYAIVLLGIILFFKMLGVGWAQVQWLIAALGVGIGFGLQEIVANFICGIIILFERPIRVGDVVTVGDTDGVVTRIQIRATTIRNWDKKELLVPNKEFVTGRLLNWSLSDQVNRLIVSVGVAYGSDIQQAKSLMLEVAGTKDCIMVDPKPSVTFESFGDNSLILVLRCFVESLDNRLAIISSLHEEINQKFNGAGINIAFPQRDLHLDSLKPLDIHVHYPDAQQAKPASSG